MCVCFFFSFFSFIFLKNLILPAERRRYLKNKNRKKGNILDGFSTQKRAIFGRTFNSTIYIYMHAVELLTGPSLGVFNVINWAKSKLLTGPMSFSHYKNWGFRRCFCSVIIVFFWCPIIWQFSKKCLFKKRAHFFFQFSVCLLLSVENPFLGLLKTL